MTTSSVAVHTVTISVDLSFIDGPNNVVGSAGPTSVVSSGGFGIVGTGAMTFDSADIVNLESAGAFGEACKIHVITNARLLCRASHCARFSGDVILHEMGHVLGIGSLWVFNGVQVSGGFSYLGGLGSDMYCREVQFSSSHSRPACQLTQFGTCRLSGRVELAAQHCQGRKQFLWKRKVGQALQAGIGTNLLPAERTTGARSTESTSRTYL